MTYLIQVVFPFTVPVIAGPSQSVGRLPFMSCFLLSSFPIISLPPPKHPALCPQFAPLILLVSLPPLLRLQLALPSSSLIGNNIYHRPSPLVATVTDLITAYTLSLYPLFSCSPCPIPSLPFSLFHLSITFSLYSYPFMGWWGWGVGCFKF